MSECGDITHDHACVWRDCPMHGSLRWEELVNLIENEPVWPGDTISHETMGRLADLKLAKRNGGGNWVPTDLGRDRFAAGPQLRDHVGSGGGVEPPIRGDEPRRPPRAPR